MEKNKICHSMVLLLFSQAFVRTEHPAVTQTGHVKDAGR